jgi:hypothetical protein
MGTVGAIDPDQEGHPIDQPTQALQPLFAAGQAPVFRGVHESAVGWGEERTPTYFTVEPPQCLLGCTRRGCRADSVRRRATRRNLDHDSSGKERLPSAPSRQAAFLIAEAICLSPSSSLSGSSRRIVCSRFRTQGTSFPKDARSNGATTTGKTRPLYCSLPSA